ncbi:MAG: hypothetical protein LBE08_03585, partial [Bifidobacteriaceae bacterium]|nr:hypothetical protein [Bifidobacteriaceae bacterium]
MLRRWLAGGAVIIGVVTVVLAVCSATVWRPADHVTAQFKAAAGTQAVITAPGVLEAQADFVTVTVDPVVPVVVAIGRETDVAAWVGDSPVETITGFTSKHAFKVSEEGSDQPIADAADSDLWVVSRQFAKEGTLQWDRRPEGRWSLVVAPVLPEVAADPAAEEPVEGAEAAPEGDSSGEGESNPTDDAVSPVLEGTTVTLTWPQQVSTPFLWPGVALGGLLALAGLLVLAATLVHRAPAASRVAGARQGRAGRVRPAP